jgi:DNA-binding winged helix-turn-helix (wHTH) protein/Tol biopolymer transport system component
LNTPEPQQEQTRRRFAFGEFTLDLDSGFLRRGHEELPLRRKSLEVLSYLVLHHKRLVAKEELIGSVWPDAIVTDNSLAQCLAEIRRALGDDSQRFIRTVARRGYIFAAPVTTPVLEFHGSVPTRPLPHLQEPMRRRFARKVALGAAILLVITGAGVIAFRSTFNSTKVSYSQITDFTDSAVAPALSPDGRMVAFIRSDRPFLTPDQVWVKLLPNGDPVRLTNDPRPKYNVAFSPDGSRIAYTVLDRNGWHTYTISPLGGEPHLLLDNAAGLGWLDAKHVLFSQVKSGQHMGIVTSTENRDQFREVYFPQHERSMAHYSYSSPDGKWALVVEMDYRPIWQPCRLIRLDSSVPMREVGPKGACTSAGWSPDGHWMYFGVLAEGKNHLWRQRFPRGTVEQITSGLSEETGIAVAPDGRSIVTSAGQAQSELWIHDSRGDRALSSEGNVTAVLGSISFPTFSHDGRRLYYLLRRESIGADPELWRMDVTSGNTQNMLPGVPMLEYDISNDEREVVWSTPGKSQIWIGLLDRSSPSHQIASSEDGSPHFGPSGEILFRQTEAKFNYLARMNKNGSGRAKVVPYPISTIQAVSPDRRWLIAITPSLNGGEGVSSIAVPTMGGTPRKVCAGVCAAKWSPNGKYLSVVLEARSRTSPGKTIAIPVPDRETVPQLPEAGIGSPLDAEHLPGAVVVDYGDESAVPGTDPSTYAYVKSTVHRNLFRIPLR